MFLLDLLLLCLHLTISLILTTLSHSPTPPKSTNDRIAHSKDITQIVSHYGYIIREHVVTTRDNYVLMLHKLEKRDQNEQNFVNRVAYFHHGLCTNSELFVLGSEFEKNLPYLLVELGWSVWLGNNRGNKYSRKHLKMSVSDKRYWDFSLDEFAYYDIPDTLRYIHGIHGSKITYIGFSQGCSQLFASLSLNPHLNEYLDHFVGLSPPIIPSKYTQQSGVLRKIVEISARDNTFLYAFFGRRAMLPSVSFWINVLPYWFYEKVVDASLRLLFNWNMRNVSPEQKRVGYRHMFSCTSVKSVIHWFQIIFHNRFQMFDETCRIGITGLSTLASDYPPHKPIPFPIGHHLDLNVLLVFGGRDNLIDVEQTRHLILGENERMRGRLSVMEVEEYEHMDTLWGEGVDVLYRRIIEQITEQAPERSEGVSEVIANELTEELSEQITERSEVIANESRS